HQADDFFAVSFELACANARDAAQQVERARANASDFSQRGVVKDDVRRHAVAPRGFQAPRPQPLEQLQCFCGELAYACRCPCPPRASLALAPGAQGNAALASQHAAAIGCEPERAVRIVVDLEDAECDALAHDGAPFALASLAADAEGAEPVVAALGGLVGRF